jgi:RHS repeat-associated protein
LSTSAFQMGSRWANSSALGFSEAVVRVNGLAKLLQRADCPQRRGSWPELSARPGAASLLSTDPAMTDALPSPSASTFPVFVRRSGGGQNPGHDTPSPEIGPFPTPNRPRPPKPRNPRNSMASNRLRRKSANAKPVHVADYLYRYMDPLTGRWTSPDPIGEKGGMNAYQMVYNAPITWIDDLGMVPLPTDKIGAEAARKARDKSAKTGYKVAEHCGLICCNKKTGKKQITGPYPGYIDNHGRPVCDKGQGGGCGQFGPDWVDVAGYHSHPNANGPSYYDRRTADTRKRPEYISDPVNDDVTRLDPDPGYDSNKGWVDGEYTGKGNGGNGGRAVIDSNGGVKIYAPPVTVP